MPRAVRGPLAVHLHRMTMKHVADGLKEHGVGSGQAMFLLELFHCDGVRQEELSRLLNVDGATTTRAITRLTQEGLVERRPDPEDGRPPHTPYAQGGRASGTFAAGCEQL